MDSEIKEVVYLAVAAMILSVVLGLVTIVTSISREMTDNRNGEVRGHESVREYRRFNKYNSNTVNGDEVVECITANYDTGLEVLVLNENYRMSSNVYIENINRDEYSDNYEPSDTFLRYRKSDVQSGKVNKYNSNSLKECYRTDSLYKAYLVYNSEKPGNKFNDIFKNSIHSDEDLDNAVGKESMSDSSVSGIIFIRIK